MKTICKVINILCLILSVLGFGVATVFIITDKTGDVGFLNDITKLDLWIIAVCLLVTIVLYTTLIFNRSKGICIGGIVVCLLGSFQSYGAALAVGMGFMINVIYFSYIESKEQKEANATPIVVDENLSNDNLYVEEPTQNNSEGINTNNNLDNKDKVVDYRPYMKPYYLYFILSIILSVSYIVLLVIGCISIVDYFRNSKDGVYVLLFALAVPFLGIIALAILIDLIYGLVASILALVEPCKSTMAINAVVGFMSLTFFNAIAAISIMNFVENVVNKNDNY